MDAKTCLQKLQYVGVLAATYQIQQEHCLHCGSCRTVCPVCAVEKRG